MRRRGSSLLLGCIAGLCIHLSVQAADVTISDDTATPQPGTSEVQISAVETNSQSAEANARLEKTVLGRLQSDQLVPSYKVNVAASGDTVTLGGKVDNLLSKERAALLAQNTLGVKKVRNNIQVAVPQRPDWEIEADLQTAYRRSPVLKEETFESDSKNQNVVLSGVVGSPHRKILAEALAKSVPGVSHVENELKVSLLQARSDVDIQMDVLSAIQWDPALGNPQVVVDVRDGKANISGVVDSQADKERIARTAQQLGVTEINLDRMRVRPDLLETPQSPGTLTPTGR